MKNILGNFKTMAIASTIAMVFSVTQLQAQEETIPEQHMTPETQLLEWREQLQSTASVKEKKILLGKIAQTGTFLGLMLTGQYMDVPELKLHAAECVAENALAHPEYNGTNTRHLLTKAAYILKGAQRERVLRWLSESSMEEGFVSLFNGKDLTGWKGLVENPIARAAMTAEELAAKQVEADERMRQDWVVEDGLLVYVGTGFDNICTEKQYKDFELYLDWRLDPNGKEPDAGIYLRGTPQVQIWDIARVDVGAQVGSGGLYNNQKNRSTPLCVADRKLGEWNSFHIKMVGEKVTVWLNGILVVDQIPLENYWDRSRPIFPCEQIELQAHGSRVYYRDIYIKTL